MRAEIYDTINDIEAVDWDGLVGPERLFQSHAWLALLESGAILDYVPQYVIVRDTDGAIAATAAAFVMPTSLVTLSSGIVKSMIDGIQRYLPWFLRPRILESGSPLGPGNGICVRQDIAMAEVAPVLCDALDRVAIRHGVNLIVLRDYLESELPAAQAFVQRGFVVSEGFPTMSLVRYWSSYDQYLRAMTSRHRQKVRRGLSLARESGLEVRWTSFSGNWAEQMALERENVRSLATEYRREQVTAQFFARLEQEFGGRARCLEILSGSVRVGHALVVEDGSVLRWLSFGRTRRGARDGAYFLVIASIVELAVREGKAVLDMGITSQGPKTDFGADRVRQWMLLRFRGPLGKLLPWAVRFFAAQPSPPPRRVFKNGGH